MDDPLEYENELAELMGSMLPFEDEFIGGELELDEDGTLTLPLLPLRGLVVFPQMVTPLFIGRDRSLAAVTAAVANGESLVVCAQKDERQADPGEDDIYLIGSEMAVGRTIRMPDNSTSVIGQSRQRVEIVEFVQWQPYIRVRVRPIPEPEAWTPDTEAMMRTALNYFESVVSYSRKIPEDAYTFALNAEDPGWLADFIASSLDITVPTKQELLQIINPLDRLNRVNRILAHEADVLETESRIFSQVQDEMDRTHREHFLREQMRVIQGELGEGDIFSKELNELRDLLEQKALPEDVRARAEKEIARIGTMSPMSPEIGVSRTYLDWILTLPWLDSSDDNLDVSHAATVLDDDHYGLERVKDRILEHIAVKQIAPDTMRTPILCLVGPPGTGKTSVGRSIARALNREFVRMSLGGVRDEAEIRGHRRTYIGALPGRIIQSIRRAGTRNPLFMLDEIDKIGQDFRGDPAAALLEVLDPEQNFAFQDHYLELDFDLSDVLFVTTANLLDPIPAPLLDRMEVIEFSGYLEEEKLEIARQFIIPRQLKQHGLLDSNVRFEQSALSLLIRRYTYEAGVRNLEREIGSVCRKIARRVAEGKRFRKRLDAAQIEKLLGPPRYPADLLRDEDEVGIATGLAWTATGGDTLAIEVNIMTGRGDLQLTGRLGDVMKESARAALSYTRSVAEQWGIDAARFEKTDIHIHLPEGAVAKDGPSAGVALVTALVSAFANRPIRRDLGMTGEITLRGRVLAVGGIREKCLAARRAGIRDVIIPAKNHSDIELIPKRLRQDINFIEVDQMQEVLRVALLPPLVSPF